MHTNGLCTACQTGRPLQKRSAGTEAARLFGQASCKSGRRTHGIRGLYGEQEENRITTPPHRASGSMPRQFCAASSIVPPFHILAFASRGLYHMSREKQGSERKTHVNHVHIFHRLFPPAAGQKYRFPAPQRRSARRFLCKTHGARPTTEQKNVAFFSQSDIMEVRWRRREQSRLRKGRSRLQGGAIYEGLHGEGHTQHRCIGTRL